MYCVKCGKEIHDEAVVCPHCGCATGKPFPNQQQKNYNPDDAPNIGYAILGFLIPIVGLILYLIWYSEYPQRAKSAGKGALISFIISVALVVIYYFIIISALASLSVSLPIFAL